MKIFKSIITGIIWTLAAIYLALAVLTHLSPVQRFIGTQISRALEHKLGTQVLIGRVDLGFLNRIIIDDVCLYDQQHEKMLTATRMSAKFDYPALFQGRVSVSSAQLFGLKAHFYRETASSVPNYQFVIDSLASKDSASSTPLDLAIHSLVIRHGHVSYNRRDLPPSSDRFSLQHLNLHEISMHAMLNRLSQDSLNIDMKSLSFMEESGLKVDQLHFELTANRRGAQLKDLQLRLPKSSLTFGLIAATYIYEDKRLEIPTLQFFGSLEPSFVTPSDVCCFLPTLKNFVNSLNVSVSFNGTGTSLFFKRLNVSSKTKSISLLASGSVSNRNSRIKWASEFNRLHLSASGIQFISANFGKQLNLPDFVKQLGSIDYTGHLGGYGSDITSNGIIRSDAGQANLALKTYNHHFSGRLESNDINLHRILNDKRFGLLAAHINVDGVIPQDKQKQLSIKAKGIIDRIDYNSYSYKNLTIEGNYDKGTANGIFSINDPHAKITLLGSVTHSSPSRSVKLVAQVDKLNPSALKLINKWPGTVFSFRAETDIHGNSFSTSNGTLDITDFNMQSAEGTYALNGLHLVATQSPKANRLTMNSDFGSFDLQGSFDYQTLPQSLANLIGNRLPTLPGLLRVTEGTNNNFTFRANLVNTDILNKMFGIPLYISQPVCVEGNINDRTQELNLLCDFPAFNYDGTSFADGHIQISSPNDSLKAEAHLRRLDDASNGLNLHLYAAAANNTLSSILSFDNNRQRRLQGTINTDTRFFTNEKGHNAAHITFHPSDILVGDTTWTVQPSDIIYSKNQLAIDHFSIEHNRQHIIVSGLGTNSRSDSLLVDLKDVDVSYILNLVNFHSVDFSGRATGQAYVTSLFSNPDASAQLTVDDFCFENGRMGILTAAVDYDTDAGQINIDAVARDEGRTTDINGYVSPRRNQMDLAVTAHHTRGDFLESFCGSFMDRTELNIDGTLHVAGPLNSINLTGMVTADGTAHIKPVNVTYRLTGDTITFVPDEICFSGDTVYDRHGHVGIIRGAVHHKHLTNFTADLDIETDRLLIYDFDGSDGSTFYGTVYGSGLCTLRTRSGEMSIDVNVTPEEESQIVYNVSSPESVTSGDFIHWQTNASQPSNTEETTHTTDLPFADIPTDVHINFLIHTRPVATLKLIMDNHSGDYISLNGSGTLRATYFNKGGVNIFGNYEIDHGLYKLTIQDIIKRDFLFTNGGTIAFGGDPYDAVLNLKAQYPLNSVSLSDLNIGRSFSSNNIPVNCLMDITGTPKSPHVSFGLDLPTVGADVKQAITSIINSEEEMNQQVLYLLAVGRFYAQGSNNAQIENSAQQSQTSLAMQSILSGQISQQLNTMLGNVINNTNWNFGANISTGDAGFDNAVYEGLLSGRLFNNRLLFNGQFGYRDNANATTSFIGDFDIRYLLQPNGNFAVRVYNQTNDRYFTRNSLTTQGLGIILKKDFNGWRDLFGIKKKKIE